MRPGIDETASKLAVDETFSNKELLWSIADMRRNEKNRAVIDLERYRIRLVLESCARMRGLDWNGKA